MRKGRFLQFFFSRQLYLSIFTAPLLSSVYFSCQLLSVLFEGSTGTLLGYSVWLDRGYPAFFIHLKKFWVWKSRGTGQAVLLCTIINSILTFSTSRIILAAVMKIITTVVGIWYPASVQMS